MKLIVLTLLGLIISAQGFRLPETAKESIQEKYTADVQVVAEVLVKELFTTVEGLDFFDQSINKICTEKYIEDIEEIRKILKSDLDACTSSPNEKQCTNAVIAKADKALVAVFQKVHQCIISGGKSFIKFHINESSYMSIETDCLDIYNPELDKIRETLFSNLEKCKTTENPEDCKKDAYAQATADGTEVFKKIHKCVTEHKN